MRLALSALTFGACHSTDPSLVPIDSPTPDGPSCVPDGGDIGPLGATWELADDAAATWTGDGEGAEGGVGTGAAVADLDGDGVLELVLATGSTTDTSQTRFGRVAVHPLEPGDWGPDHARATVRVTEDIGHVGLRAWPQPRGDGTLALWMAAGADGVVVDAPPPGEHAAVDVADLLLPDAVPLGPAADLDGDGRGELLVRHHDGVAVRDGATGALLVLWTLPQGHGARRADGRHDVTGDGQPDLVVWVHADDPYLLVLDAPLEGGDAALAAVGRIDGVRAFLPPQHTLADLDGDGLVDLVVGDPADAAGACESAGGARVFRGPLLGARTVHDADLVIGGDREGGLLGVGVAVGDLDGDGHADLVVAESRYAMSVWSAAGDAPARLLVFAGPLAAGSLRAREATVAWRADGPGVGYALVSGFDADGDGRDDLIVGAPRHGEDARGRAWWVPGRAFRPPSTD